MKKIDTLVQDIYNLFSPSPLKMSEEEVDKYIDICGDMIKVHIKEFLYEKPQTNGHLRLSAIGKPDRQLWYNINSTKQRETLTPSTRIKFLYGYILEELLLLCSSIAGHTVEQQQKEVEVIPIRLEHAVALNAEERRHRMEMETIKTAHAVGAMEVVEKHLNHAIDSEDSE